MDKQHNEDVQHFEPADVVVVAVDEGGSTHRTSEVVEAEVVMHPIVGRVRNLEGEPCDGKVWREQVEVGRVEEPEVEAPEVVEGHIVPAEVAVDVEESE